MGNGVGFTTEAITMKHSNFNLIDEPWIPVLYHDGRCARIGIQKAMEEAGSIRQIAASNPMDLFAIYRLLLTMIYWKANAAGGVESLRGMLLKGKTPRAIIDAIDGARVWFDLFDNKRPFFQDVTAQNEKHMSAGSLFAEMANGTNIAHFHHGDDESMRLCRPCAAIGMLRLVPWTQSGGAGKTPAVHNAPPIMVLARGQTLAQTLGLNLVPLKAKPGKPTWSGHFIPSNPAEPMPYLEAFTWNPRRVYLGKPQLGGTCGHCGSRCTPVVGPIVYAKNDRTKQNKKGNKSIPFQWQDPAAFYPADKPYTTIKSYDEELAASGRDLVALTGTEKPASFVARANPDHRDWLLIIPCTNPANNKTFDHRIMELTSVSADALRASLPAVPIELRAELNGWTEPSTLRVTAGASHFVRAAALLLTAADWAILSTAAFREMNDSPAAFDILSGLLWSLRGRKVAGLPSRNVAWLILKFMASVPSHARMLYANARFCPISELPKQQLDERRGDRAKRSRYPVSFPRGHRLEGELRSALDRHLRQRGAGPIDWAGLCSRLDQMLD
jgi:hypothetical protein